MNLREREIIKDAGKVLKFQTEYNVDLSQGPKVVNIIRERETITAEGKVLKFQTEYNVDLPQGPIVINMIKTTGMKYNFYINDQSHSISSMTSGQFILKKLW